MKIICDLHIHSKYSGGTSSRIELNTLNQNSTIKGIDLIGTGDCLHPLWLKELKENLQEFSKGIYYIPKCPKTKFILQTEIELIWRYKHKIRKIHLILLIPNFETVIKLNDFCSKYGKLDLDGRPKLFINAEDFIFKLKQIDFFIEIIPAHIFSPFFGVLGSKPNFKSLKDALGNSLYYINAVESGLSADPNMIRCLSELNDITIISNSDAHSTNFHRIGRETTVINIQKINYNSIINAIQKNHILKTYEFKPSGGKYYYDGHRSGRHFDGVDYYCSPKRNVNKCPYCGKPITKGVLSRVYELSNQDPPDNHRYQYIIPLLHLISVILGGTEYSPENISLYKTLVKNNEGEYKIWDGSSNLNGISDRLIDAIEIIRRGDYYFLPGHDGVYGELKLEV